MGSDIGTTTVLPLAIMIVFCAVAASASGWAHAEPIQVYISPVPAQARPADRIGVPVESGGNCGEAVVDPARPPEIRLVHSDVDYPGTQWDQYRYEVQYWLLDQYPDDLGCPSPPSFPNYYRLIDVGSLPAGLHGFDVKGHVDGIEFTHYRPSAGLVGPYSPGASVSGVWWAPEQSGRGITVTWGRPISVVHWSTHDAAGQPASVTLLSKLDHTVVDGNAVSAFEGIAVSTSGPPLADGAADITAHPWGRIKFTYERCGRATFEWDAFESKLGHGELELTQLVVPHGIEPCDISLRSAGLVARWVD